MRMTLIKIVVITVARKKARNATQANADALFRRELAGINHVEIYSADMTA